MPINKLRIQQALRDFSFRQLFIEELGWDNPPAAAEVTVDGQQYTLPAIAHKRGMVAYLCPAPDGARIPEYSLRRKIEQQVSKVTHEHLIVFTDPDKTFQIWQWVKREPGKPSACREHTFHKSQSGEALIQRLHAVAFTIDEEETLTLVDVAGRTRKGFDMERVTKRFFDQFKKEHACFLKLVEGIDAVTDREWYASVMLNRLMFVYFIQRKGFLDGDRDYLRHRLDLCKRHQGKDKFYSFYRDFLLRLFHGGFGKRRNDRGPDLEKLLGNIPYLNGGLFDVHELERPDRYGNHIQIPDEAFARIFDYFDQYQWHLDERPLREANEINPDVLGYIFERYINQKQMGAYYTKEDITEYISKNTILPFLFDAARSKCRVAFENTDGPTVWDLLRENPDRYIYPAVRHGTDRDLPPEIAAGLDTSQPNLIERRRPWNKPAPPEFALPTEIWREVVARRQRYQEVCDKLAAGEVRDINDLITLNLDIRQFAQDVIEQSEGPELLRAFWHAMERITVLDPTCGSGAFLFAALNILEPLYEACLNRMEVFLEDLGRSGDKRRPEKLSDFRKVMERLEKHPNRRYFIFKNIILNNLFGVDIMEEAVEICKLRLFLKLAAQVEPDTAQDNLGIEPLPDIDFNIRAGNTLVGYATADEVRRCMTQFGSGQMRLGLDDELQSFTRFTDKLEIAEAAFRSFRQQQIELGGAVTAHDKAELRDKLKALEDELNGYLAGEYGVKPSDKSAFAKWSKSHQPLHWFTEFFGILNQGGFDVIIGNPPYVSAAKAGKAYTVKNLACADCSDIYAWVMERSESLLRDGGRTGMIVPLSLGFSGDFDSCRRLLLRAYGGNWFSSFGRIPAALFAADVRVRNTIHIGHKGKRAKNTYTTRLHRWFESARPTLLEAMDYVPFRPELWKYRIPKLNTARLGAAFERAFATSSHTLEMSTSVGATKHIVHFKKSAYNWLNFCRALPPCYEDGKRVEHTKFGEIYFDDAAASKLALLLANGKLMLIFWFAIGDDFDVTRWNFAEFPADLSSLPLKHRESLLAVVPVLERAMSEATQFKLNAGRRVGNYNLAKCRSVTDKSDHIFAESLGFTCVWEDVELYYAQTMKTDFSDEASD